MIKNKKFMVILVVFVLSAALMTGCNAGTEGGAGLGGENSANVVGNPVDEGRAIDKEKPAAPTNEEQAVTGNQASEAQATANVEGTVKAFDANTGMITLTTQSAEKLELKVTGDSKILVSASPATLDKLSTIIGSGVSVEYYTGTNTVTKINVKG